MRVEIAQLLVLLHFAAADHIFSGPDFRHAAHQRKYENRAYSVSAQSSSMNTRIPIEYLKTPNFDVMLLSEQNSDPTWQQYSQLFPPADIRNAPQIEVNYGSHTATPAEGLLNPFIRLDRPEVESVLASLGGKKHIIVLHPRDCTPHSTARGVDESSLNKFENEFLPKLLQQLHTRSPEQRVGTDATTMDPIVDRILAILDKDEQKILDDLRKSFEGNPKQIKEQGQMYASGYTTMRRKPSPPYKTKVIRKPKQKSHLDNILFKDSCNEGYVFMVENHKNAMDPKSLNDFLLRVLKVVAEETT